MPRYPSPESSGGGPPSGPAGGSLTGTYPNPGLVPASAIVAGSESVDDFSKLSTVPTGAGIQVSADWAVPTSDAVPNWRWYALDGVSGDDSNAGYSDVSAAAAGLVAVRTTGRLNLILPVDGKGRNCMVMIAAGTYAGGTPFACGRLGYNYLIYRGTATNATASSTAFLDDSSDRTFNGNVTATGMNAAGYNPTGSPTTRALQCLKVGGAAPAFAAELPMALPGGARLRFDVATSTAALRNIRRSVVKVSGTDTLEVDKLLPAVPAAADVFYLEMPGVNFDFIQASGIQSNGAGIPFSVAGFRATGNTAGARGVQIIGFVQACQVWLDNTSSTWSNRGFAASNNSVYTVPGATVDTGGACRSTRQMSTAFVVSSTVGVGTAPYASSFSYSRLGGMELPGAFVSTAGVAVNLVGTVAVPDSDPDSIGTNPAQASAGWRNARIIGPSAAFGCGVYIGASIVLCGLEVDGIGALPAIKVAASGATVLITTAISGTTGNTDVGLDLTSAKRCAIILAATPTVTGSAGDIRIAGGQIVTWAQAAATGIVDSQGNRIIGTAGPLDVQKFSGAIVSSAGGATISYLADTGAQLIAANLAAQRYPTSMRLAMRLRVTKLYAAGVLTNNVTCTLYKNGVATAMAVTVLTGDAVNTKYVDSANPVLFVDGDDYDLRLDDAADALAGVGPISAALEWAT